MTHLTTSQIDELDAVAETTRAIGGPTFIHRSNWLPDYCGLVRQGLVTWGPPPKSFSPKRFAGVSLTPMGHWVLASAMSARSGETARLAPKDASAVGDSRDAQAPSSQSSIDYRGGQG